MPFKRGRISPDMPIKRGTSLDLPAHRKHCPRPPTWGRARVVLAGDGAIAQLGERLVRNEEVSGSIPLGSTNPLNLGEIGPFTASDYHARCAVQRSVIGCIANGVAVVPGGRRWQC